jgi:type II secretory pathway pseudopilin PulG
MQYCAYCGNAVDAVSYAPCPRCGNPSNGAPRPVASAKGSNTAMIVVIVIVGGLFVVAVIGILAAIAIPNLLTAQQRAKQRRTMADIRSLSAAIEASSTDKNEYPKGSTAADLAGALSPTYIKTVPALDGWQHAFKYTCLKDATTPDSEKCAGYTLASAGKDGIFEQPSLENAASQEPRTTTNFDCDIVYSNGKFVEYPEGVQH